ncbi:DUF3592 domain-containing protein [Nocardiopsis sp. YSL2]|uniref:DUF3592 domain-containing protein n=1 Tax=Nocardiopsis sp. YSL2 TaxID=2939492 RepID=UPI0026F47E5D|nr:DUF3592 domain-containing protein [Nocardiopsis sp. YSL2]
MAQGLGAAVLALALFSVMGGLLLGELAEPRVRHAALAEHGAVAEAVVVGAVDEEPLVEFVTDRNQPVRTTASGRFAHDGAREVEVRYLPSDPDTAMVSGHRLMPWGLVLSVGGAAAVGWALAVVWHERRNSPAQRWRRKRERQTVLPVARWAVPAVLMLGASAGCFLWPFVAIRFGAVDVAGVYLWSGVGTAVLSLALGTAWRAVVRHADRGQVRRRGGRKRPAGVRNRALTYKALGRVTLTLLVGFVSVVLVRGIVLMSDMIAPDPVLGTDAEVVEVQNSSRGCRAVVRVAYTFDGLEYEQGYRVGCSDSRRLRDVDDVRIGVSATDPTRIRPLEEGDRR